MATTPKRVGRPPKTAPAKPVEAPESVSETTSKPTLDLTPADLKIVSEAMLGLPNTPENVDVYYKIETYRQELREYLSK
jgi:hypothetical protein